MPTACSSTPNAADRKNGTSVKIRRSGSRWSIQTTPTGSEVDELTDIADKHDASAAQISLAWLREKDVTTIPKATSTDHIEDNWGSLGVDLDDEDIETIDGIDRRERQVDPDFAPW